MGQTARGEERPTAFDFRPPSPGAAYFDTGEKAWVLSRYTDVLAAFRENRLIPIGSGRAVAAKDKLREETITALGPEKLAVWRERLAALAERLAAGLPSTRTVDLVSEFLRPYCTAVAVSVTGADPSDGERLADLAAHISAVTAENAAPELEARAKAARVELERCLPAPPMGEPVFVALSQTLKSLLSNSWLALMQNPSQLQRLQSDRSMMTSAIEELIRYAGVTRKLYRRAFENVTLGGITIAKGEDAILMVASANWDADQFAEPDVFDIGRRATSQLGFGSGDHSCVGAALIRMGATVATSAMVGRMGTLVRWRGDRFVTGIEVRM